LIKKYDLFIENLDSDLNIANYRDVLDEEWNMNVYYSIEHLKYFTETNQSVKYFTFNKNNKSIIVLPLIFRKIEIKDENESYYDVVSPYGYSGPLLKQEVSKDDIIEFWKQVDLWYKENNVISEFIRFSLDNNHTQYSGKLIPSLSNIRGNLLIDFEDQWELFLPKVRNNYRRATQNSLKFKLFDKAEINKDIITVFYEIYTDTMKRNKASQFYFFSIDYFENLILGNPNVFSIAISYFEDKPVSVELIINYLGTIYAFLGGTNSEYFSIRPNDFLRVEIIKWAINMNKKYYILGGGMKDGDGLHKYKKSLFPKDKEVIFYTGRKVINQELYDKLCETSCNTYKSIHKNDLDNYFFPYYRTKK